MKTCTKCKIEKLETEFYKTKDLKSGLRSECKQCTKLMVRDYQREYQKAYRKKHPEKARAVDRKYKDNHKEIIKQRNKTYIKKNSQIINEKRKQKRAENPFFKMKCYLITRTSKIFRKMSLSKPKKTEHLLGTSYEIVKQHIENQFKDKMNWSNYGEWHIDHIIPLASARDMDELIALCHYSNLQPLWAEENLKKQDKIVF